MSTSVRSSALVLAHALAGCAKAGAPAAATPSDAAAGPAAESITNVQEAGVDEGGIVKIHGDHLVVLRRGRLFTVDVGRGRLAPVDWIDVTPSRKHDAWYDEMLVHGDTIVVVGYSYRVGATEIGLFTIDERGALAHEDTYFLRSNDYYSSRNYASRLVGDQLIFYMPHWVGGDPEHAAMPAMNRWHRKVHKDDDWDRIVADEAVVPPVAGTKADVLHTLVSCDLGRPDLGCSARGILGGMGRTFYVSPSAVYVWTADIGHAAWGERMTEGAAIYRLPLDGGPIGAVLAAGAPVDQFSLDEEDGELRALVRSETVGDAMWGPELAAGDVGFVRVPAAAFAGERGTRLPSSAYEDLPDPGGNEHAFQNRFVGDALLYGTGNGWGYTTDAPEGAVFVHKVGERTARVGLPHGVDRLEALGKDGLVVGSDGNDLYFSSLALGGAPEVVDELVQRGASQGELRSHGFFFSSQGPGHGVLGLPVRRWNEPGFAHLFRDSAEILYLDVDDLRFGRLGALAAKADGSRRDRCIASCVDWYGNARPIFLRDRVFALLGYELVEGRIDGGRIEETRRVDMIDLLREPMQRAG